MLNVLIIDDEPNVRQGLKIIIPWKENEFEICGESGDPDEGLKMILTLQPDIVLIDIKLPGKLGVEIIKESREHGFKGKFIIISGYSNFEYAKDAIKYGVKSYILKPVDEDELIEILLKLKGEINQERRWEKNKKIIEEFAIKKLFLEKNEELEKELSRYESFQVAIVFDEFSKDKEKSIAFLENSIKNKLNKYTDEIDVVRINQYIAILFKDFRSSRVYRTLIDLKIRISSELGRNIFITLGSEKNKAEMISDSFKDAESLLKDRFLYYHKELVSIDKVKEELKNIKYEKVDVDKLYSFVEVNDVEEIKACLLNIKNSFIIEKFPEEEIKVHAIKILLGLIGKLSKDYDLKVDNYLSEENIVRDINNIKSIEALIDYLINNFIEVSAMISERSSYGIIKKMIIYINKNYYKDLKLEGLSEIFNYNSAYLGKLFKSEVGENFNTYLDKVRIKEAKKLLLEDYVKVYQISEKVGYKNIDYFHSKFKKYVGMSPMSYRKNNEKS